LVLKKCGGLGLGLGLETQSLGLGLGLDKKVLFTSLVTRGSLLLPSVPIPFKYRFPFLLVPPPKKKN